MKRFNIMLIAIVVAAATALSWGITPVRAADQPAGPANPAAQEALAKQRAAADAVEARRLRDEAWQRRKAMREAVEQIKQGLQPGQAPAEPGNPAKGGAK